MADDYSGYGAAAQMGVSMLGQYMASQSRDKQQQILQKALDEFGKIDLPSLQKVISEQQGPSAFQGIQDDPEALKAQYEALDSLKGISDAGGLTLTDKANLNRVRNEGAALASSGQKRIEEQMAGRGNLDSGAQLAMLLQGNQAAANRASQQDMDIAGGAQQRALDALLHRGQMAGNIRQQGFNEQSRKAEAADLISRQNADARSKANYYNAGLAQQQYDNQLKRAGGMSGQYGNMANFQGANADRTQQLYAGAGNTAGSYFDKKTQQSIQAENAKRNQPTYSSAPMVSAGDPDEWNNPYGGY